MSTNRNRSKFFILALLFSLLLVSLPVQANSGMDVFTYDTPPLVPLGETGVPESAPDQPPGRLEHLTQIKEEETQRVRKEAPSEKYGLPIDAGESLASIITAPGNDNIASATVVSSLPYTDTVDTTAATVETGEPEYSCGSEVGATVWYSYTPTSGGYIVVDTNGSSFDTVLHVYEDLGGGNLSLVGCADDGGEWVNSKFTLLGGAGTTYLIGVGGYLGDSGSMLINMKEVAPFTSCAGVDVPVGECVILDNLYTGTGGASWYNNSGWFMTDEVCTWYGIICYGGNVSEINLGYNNLSGPLSTDFSGLPYLWWVVLSSNQLTGDISTIIGNLPTTLGGLYLSNNQFTGTIPSGISSFTTLYGFSVGGNQLTGNISTLIGYLTTNLWYLYLYDNQFTGTIPSGISSFTNLFIFYAGGNQLTGDMTTIIGYLPTGLTSLSLHSNQITGTITSGISSFTGLLYLNVGGNQLTGDMATIIGYLPTGLDRLYLWGNQFTGTIPSGISSFSNLYAISVFDNQLTGDLSTIIGYLPSELEYLWVNDNQFTGTIPSTISSLPYLWVLDVSYNSAMSGTLPLDITGLSLDYFSFEQTYLCEPNDPAYDTWKSGVLEYTSGLCVPIVSVAPTGTIIENTPAYEWLEGGDATQYQLVINNSVGGEVFSMWYTTGSVCGGGTCSKTPVVYLNNGDYSWTVRGMYGGVEGPWTTPTEFTVANPLPGKAALSAPTGTITEQSPTYSWDELSNADWYLLVVKKNGTDVATWLWKTAGEICAGGTCSVTPGKLLGAGEYTWWVLGNNAIGNGAWSRPGDFILEGRPDRPALYAPDGTIFDQTPTYSWEDVYSAEDYLLVVKKNGTEAVTWLWRAAGDICTAGTCEVDPGKKLGAGSYTFWVLATNSYGFGFWSLPSVFTIEGTPDRPALYAPTGTISESAPEYSWEDVYSAEQYVLVVRDSGSNVEVWTTYNAGDICGAGTCAASPAGVILPVDSYTWMVLPKNSYGNGFWSLPESFTVTTP